MRDIKSLFILIIIVAAVFGLFWIARFLGSGEKVESEKPVVICQPQSAPPAERTCFWTTHIHATVKVFRGDAEVPIRFEQGTLEGEHTHAERDIMHWHGLMPADPISKEVNDWSALRVDTIPQDLKLSITGTPKFIVNGKEVEPSSIWQDGDVIEIRYESR